MQTQDVSVITWPMWTSVSSWWNVLCFNGSGLVWTVWLSWWKLLSELQTFNLPLSRIPHLHHCFSVRTPVRSSCWRSCWIFRRIWLSWCCHCLKVQTSIRTLLNVHQLMMRLHRHILKSNLRVVQINISYKNDLLCVGAPKYSNIRY